MNLKKHTALATVVVVLAIATALLLYPRGSARSDNEIVQTPNLMQEVLLNAVVQKLIDCESSGRSVRIVDSNGYYSYGILQYQKATWDYFSKQSGIVGDPMVPNDAIEMTRWAVKNGHGEHWTCWRNVPKEWRQW